MMNQIIDRFGLVRPRYEFTDTGNGMIYSEVFCSLFPQEPAVPYIEVAMGSLYRRELSLLWRTPENTYGQESHDNYMAFACFMARNRLRELAREVFWSAFRRGFYLKNVPLELEGKPWKEKLKRIAAPWMGRFPRIWLSTLAIAYPGLIASLCCTLITLLLRFESSVNVSDASGCQLKWLDRMTLYWLTGNRSPLLTYLAEFRTLKTSLSEVMATYWAPDHIVITGYRHAEQEVLS